MREYLVEVTPGREVLYRTPYAFRVAMRSGEITADARIFHRATSNWISITEHPEYRRLQAEPYPPPWFDPPMEPEPAEPTTVPNGRGFLRNFAAIGAALRRERAIAESFIYHRATSGWASLKGRFASVGTKSVRSSKPVRAPKAAKAPKPAPAAQPGQSPPQTVTNHSEPSRNRWTFYP